MKKYWAIFMMLFLVGCFATTPQSQKPMAGQGAEVNVGPIFVVVGSEDGKAGIRDTAVGQGSESKTGETKQEAVTESGEAEIKLPLPIP